MINVSCTVAFEILTGTFSLKGIVIVVKKKEGGLDVKKKKEEGGTRKTLAMGRRPTKSGTGLYVYSVYPRGDL